MNVDHLCINFNNRVMRLQELRCYVYVFAALVDCHIQPIRVSTSQLLCCHFAAIYIPPTCSVYISLPPLNLLGLYLSPNVFVQLIARNRTVTQLVMSPNQDNHFVVSADDQGDVRVHTLKARICLPPSRPVHIHQRFSAYLWPDYVAVLDSFPFAFCGHLSVVAYWTTVFENQLSDCIWYGALLQL